MRNSYRKALLLTAGAMAAMAASSAAVAAETAADGGSEAQSVESVIVTGSRIVRAGFEAPTPTTVIDAAVLNSAPQPNLAANLNQLPVLSGSTSPRTAGTGAGGGTQGANFLNLRSLGASRTLVLLDNRRVVGAATTGAVDFNLLPTTLLRRVDIVTGGASAAWGSDAVAGVVNLVLDKTYTGLKGSIQGGISDYNDGAEFRADVAAGHSFAGGRGHIIASGAFSRAASVDRVDSRSWFKGVKLFNNPAYAAGNGQPKLIVADNVNSSTATFGGLITAYRTAAGATVTTPGGLVGTQFLAGGDTARYDFGTVGTNVGGLGNPALPGSYAASQLGINGTRNDLAAPDQIIADTKTYSTFLRGSYELNDAVNLYGEFIYGKSIADSFSVPYLTLAPNATPLTIQSDNAYLPASVAAAMAAAGATSFTMGRENMDLGFSSPHNERKLYRYVAGADIKLGGSWSAQVYYEHGVSKVLNEIRNDAIVSNFTLSVDSVRNSSGAIVCGATIPGRINPVTRVAYTAADVANAAGCVPLNSFGWQTYSSAQRSWFVGTAWQRITLTQDVAAASINGDLFSLPAGAVTFAGGAEYRKEDHTATADDNSQRNNTNTGPGTGNWFVGNYKPSSGGYDVKEGFAEILVPLLKDSPLARQLDFNGAVRLTDYSTSGRVTTWKAGLTWDVVDGLKLRGVRSRDIRAPNLQEYFLGGTANTVSLIDGPNGAVGALRLQSGNAKLTPEIASTTALGVVLQPRFIRNFSLSVDYFRIKLDDAIAIPTPQYIVDRCRDGSIPSMCGLLVRDGTGRLTTVLVQPFNYKTEFMSGYDIEAGYRFQLGGGTVNLRSLWTYTPKHYLVDNGAIDNLVGEVNGGGPVKWRGFNSISYDLDRFSFSVRHRYIGRGVLDAAWTPLDVDNNRIPAVNYFDMSATAKFKAGGLDLEAFAAVDNLFDKAPPAAPQIGGNPNTNIGTSGAYYDLVGRYYRAGLRFRM